MSAPGVDCALPEEHGALVSHAMSTLGEIQDAVAQLPHNEKKALQIWLNSQAELEMSSEEEQRLLHSLDAAMRDVDAGQGVSMDEVRQRVNSWAAK